MEVVLILINVGSIHLVDGVKGRVGKSFVTQAMFFYCLMVLRLPGLERMGFSEVDAVICSEKRRQKRRRNFGSFYLTNSNNSDDDDVEKFVDCKYKNIPLLLVNNEISERLVYLRDIKSPYQKFREVYTDLTWDINFHDCSGINNSMESIFEAAGKRIVIVDIGCWSSSVIAYWWNFDEMTGLIDTIPTKFVRWFVCDGERDSLDLFVDES